VDISLTDTGSNSNFYNRDLAIVISVLESGNSVELPATGYSMFPALRPGNRVIIKPLPEGDLPELGSVVVYRDNNILVMHRLVEIITADKRNPLFITRGDSMMAPDKPFPLQKLLGVAVRYKGVRKEHSLKTHVPRAWRYEYNRRLLWLFFKFKKLFNED
jgi:signal peptidase I